ncbi:FGGY-family carbohydrate kinase [Leptothrix discophora]|uniref:L-fuculose kinase n=1 Tax=Leptothrix discophora TaxID=89 RepID=A0ABT9FYL5_LEPDI|nr:FGGY family carbohydrate kinase [Leptothrix discophora]MDP4299307.1 L-fuculose kinase [Leptothrix discophora]
MPLQDDLTLVLDIGKSNAKLLLIDADGHVRERRVQPNASTPAAVDGPAYTALGVAALQGWLLDAIPALAAGDAVRRLSITTHGAAFCGIDADGLVLPPMDYEWDGYGELHARHAAAVDAYADSGSPRLPQGLNAGIQLHWLLENHPEACQRVQHWLAWPQYWAWWFSGVAASERSSLGCHTDLWRPRDDRPSDWAVRSGLAARFAPMRSAWEVLGPLRPALAAQLGLRGDVQVHVGSHDSNACLARYLPSHPDATVVSTGTWCVLMAPGAATERLDAAHDQLVNVAVDGRPVATARFMGGREFAAICGDADPLRADEAALAEVLAQGWLALPAHAESGGPYAGRQPQLLRHGSVVEAGLACVPAALRPALAALYCAQLTAERVTQLDGGGAPRPLVLEGPLAGNAAWLRALAGLCPGRPLLRPDDELEGTARGAWLLTRPLTLTVTSPPSEATPAIASARLQRLFPHGDDAALQPSLDRVLQARQQQWVQALA